MADKSETIATKEDRVNEAKELFGRGSRNFCLKQFAEAADDLSSCCAIYSELHGPQAVECGLPYLLYAKSLIALGKDENNLIVPGDDEEEADEDDDEEEAEEEGGDGDADGKEKAEDGGDDEPMDTNETPEKDGKPQEEKPAKEDASKKEASSVVEKKDEEADKDSGNEMKAEKVEAAEGSRAEGGSSIKDADDEPEPGPSTSNGVTTADQGETEDGAGNLQVAWEILELAVKIFEEQGDSAHENLSECYSELAGISFENSHFVEAINDYTKAMEISKKTNKSDLRMLAEVHYKVGLCHLMVNDFDASVKSFKGAIGELEKVIEQEKAKEQTDETKETIAELEETKNDILEKIADVEEAKKTSIEEVKRELSKIIVSGGGESSNGVNKGAGTSSSSSSAPSTAASSNGSGSKPTANATKPATDISHLIKRKKPDSASTEVEGSPAKKTASETDGVSTHNTSA